MDCPGFQVSQYGLFDSRVKFPTAGPARTRPRPVREYELEFYTADYGMAYIDGEAHPMRSGTFLCAKPGQTRCSDLPFRCSAIHLTTHDPDLDRLLRALPDHAHTPDPNRVNELFHTLLRLDPDAPAAPLELAACVARLLALVARGRPHPDSDPHTRLLDQARDYIRAHLDQPLSLASVAARVNLSPSHFHRLFTLHFGCTPGRYINACRVDEAKVRLLREDVSLPAVAARCGFASQSYFCSCFKAATGLSPLAYRKQMLGRMEL